MAQEDPDAGIQRAVRRGRCRAVLRRQALQPDQGSEVLRAQGDARVRPRRCAGRDHVRQQAAYRHLPPHRRGCGDARGNHRPRRRGALRDQGHRSRDRGLPARRRGAGQWRDTSQPACGAGPGSQLPRHLPYAASPGRAYRSQAVCHRFPHRASAGHDRPGPSGQVRRPSGAGRRGLQTGVPRQERPRGLQLLHVPGRHRGGRHVGAGTRGDQRHEPVLAQRAQCQRRHRRRHQPRAGFPRRCAGRRGAAGASGISRLRAGRQRLLRARATGRRLHSRRAVDRVRRGRAVLQARRAPGRSGALAAGICHRGDPRSAAGLRQADPWVRSR